MANFNYLIPQDILYPFFDTNQIASLQRMIEFTTENLSVPQVILDRLDDLEADVDQLQLDMTAAQGDIDTLELAMTAVEGDIAALELDVAAAIADTVTGASLNSGTGVLTINQPGGNTTVDLSPLAAAGGGGAPNTATYLVTALNAGLSNERVLTAGTNVSFVDGGANGAFTINVASTGIGSTSVLTAIDEPGASDSRQLLTSTGLQKVDSGAGGTLTLSLANTAVTPGTYTYSTFTVDAQGRITSASSGSTPYTQAQVNSLLAAKAPINAPSFTGAAVFADQITVDSNLISSDTSLFLATTGAGTIAFRPNGIGSTTGQMFVNSAGALSVNGTVTASGTGSFGSDKRWKENIRPIHDALEIVEHLKGVRFQWKEDKKHDLGFIAQEVKKVLPELVHEDDNGFLFLSYQNLTAVLVEAVKDQQNQINDLAARLEALENK